MEKAILDFVINKLKNEVKTDAEFIKLEKKKNKLMKQLKLKLTTDEDKRLLDKLTETFQLQIFMTAANLCIIELLDKVKSEQHKY